MNDDIRDLTVRALSGRIKQLEDAIWWALGENGEFKDRSAGSGSYWWRTELRERALIPTKNTPNGGEQS